VCRAKPELLELGNFAAGGAKSIAERKQLRIIALGSSSTSGYGVSNPAFAYPAQLKMGLDKALPGIDVDVINRGIGGQDVEEMAARMRAEMQGNPASLVVWQTGTNAAIRQMPLDKFEEWLRKGLALGKSLGADFVLMNLQYVPAVVAARQGLCKVMAAAAGDTMRACSAASTSCAAGTRTACPMRSSCSATDCLNDFGQVHQQALDQGDPEFADRSLTRRRPRCRRSSTFRSISKTTVDPAPFGPNPVSQAREHGQIASFFPGLKKEDLPDDQG
jgi:hypothetical protein